MTNSNELDISLALISETWLKKNKDVEKEFENIEAAENISSIRRDRGSRGGGVCIAYNKE